MSDFSHEDEFMEYMIFNEIMNDGQDDDDFDDDFDDLDDGGDKFDIF